MTEEVVGEVVREVRRRLATRAGRGAGQRERAELGRQAEQLRREIQRLGEALLSTGEAPHTLVRMMREREIELSAIDELSAVLKEKPTETDLDTPRLEKAARVPLADLRRFVQSIPEEARTVLGALLRKPLLFTFSDVPPRGA